MGSTASTPTSFSHNTSSTTNSHSSSNVSGRIASGSQSSSLSDLLSGYNNSSSSTLISLKSNGQSSLASIDSECCGDESSKQVSYSSLHSFPPTRRRKASNASLLNNSTGNAKSCPLLPAVGTRVSTASSSKRSGNHSHHQSQPSNDISNNNTDDNSHGGSVRLPNLNISASSSSNTSNFSSSASMMNNNSSPLSQDNNLLTKNTSKNSLNNNITMNGNNSTTYSSSPPISSITTYSTPNSNSHSSSSSTRQRHHSLHSHQQQPQLPFQLLSTPSVGDSLLNHPITPKVKSPSITSNIPNIFNNSPIHSSPTPNHNISSQSDDTGSLKSDSTTSSLQNSPRRVSLLQVAEQIHPLSDLISVPRLTQSRSLGILEEYLPTTTNSTSSLSSSNSSGQLQTLSASNSGNHSGRRSKKSITPTLKEIQDMCCASENLSYQIDMEESLEKKRKQYIHKNRTELAEPFPRVGTAATKTREPRFGDSLSTQTRRNQTRRTKGPDYDLLRCETETSPKGLDAILKHSSRTLTNYGNDDVAIYITSPTSAPEINTPTRSIAKEKKKRVLMLHQKRSERKNNQNRRSHSVIGMVHH